MLPALIWCLKRDEMMSSLNLLLPTCGADLCDLTTTESGDGVHH